MAMEKALKDWKNLRVVDTIYEEEHEDDSSPTSSVSSSLLSSPSTHLHIRAQAWSMAAGLEPDVVIRIHDSCFQLHKEILACNSGFMRKQLKKLQSLEFTLSPPLKITAETFALVAVYCYGAKIIITPSNFVGLRIAAELLEMTDLDGAGDDNLLLKTEVYFQREVAVNGETASIVFRSALAQLPEAETTSFLVSRCIEALILMDDYDDVMSCIDDVKTVPFDDFRVIVESFNRSVDGSHDFLYKIVDFYLKANENKLTEGQSNRICSYIDCTSLSTEVLMHAVQNQRMTLRFVVQAMFVEQIKARHSIMSTAEANHHNRISKPPNDHHKTNGNNNNGVTLGTILERDAALSLADQLKAELETTSSRVQSLEREINGMRMLLNLSQGTSDSDRSGSLGLESKRRVQREENRSASSRLESQRKVKREEKKSASFHGTSFTRKEGQAEESCDKGKTPKAHKSLGGKLVKKLKRALGVSGSATKKNSGCRDPTKGVDQDGKGNEDVLVIKKDVPFNGLPHAHAL